MNVQLPPGSSWHTSMRKHMPKALPLLVVLGGVGLFVVFSSLQPARPAPTIQSRSVTAVRTIPLSPRTVTLNVVGHGSARSRDRVHIASQVTGRVAFVASNLRVGSFVGAGEVLLRLDPRDATIAHRRATADLARAEAVLQRLLGLQRHLEVDVELRRERVALSQAEHTRQLGLQDSGIASVDRIDQARSAWVQELTVLRASERELDLLPHDLARARALRDVSAAALEQAALTLERLTLRAPIAGQVRTRNVDLGQVVAAGTPLIGLAGQDVYEVPVQLSHDDLLKLARIPSAAVPRGVRAPPSRTGESPATVTWVARPESQWQGTLTRIESVDADTRTIPGVVEVRAPWASLESGGLPLLPGAYCRVELLGQTRPDAWVIPEHTLREGHRIFVHRDGVLVIVDVRVEHYLDGEAVIHPLSRLQAGDQLVVSPLAYPVAGMTLRVEASE